MHKIKRFSASALLAITITFGLFFLMQLLIESGNKERPEDDDSRFIDMVRVDREEDVRRIERVERPPEQVKPPELLTPQINTATPGPTVYNFQVSTGPQNLAGTGISTGDGEYLPIVKVDPVYPRRARELGIAGYVTVQYTVTTQGTTKDVVVIDADPRGYFERAAVRAAEKYKYKPRVINGQPVEVPGVKTKITFLLADD